MKKAVAPSVLIAVILLAVAVIAEAQQQTKVTIISFRVLRNSAGKFPKTNMPMARI
jgi:hypothetical protein